METEEEIKVLKNGKILVKSKGVHDIKDGETIVGSRTENSEYEVELNVLEDNLGQHETMYNNLISQLEDKMSQMNKLGKLVRITPRLKRLQKEILNIGVAEEQKKILGAVNILREQLEEAERFIIRRKVLIEEAKLKQSKKK